ncbi:MAG: hypothetical protein U0575_05965 [Phycisphaerales bacterium]
MLALALRWWRVLAGGDGSGSKGVGALKSARWIPGRCGDCAGGQLVAVAAADPLLREALHHRDQRGAGEPGSVRFAERFLDRPSTSFHMGMRIARTADPQRLEWTIVYGEGDARQERPYELLVDDAARGAFTVDERNGIAIPARLIGGTLWSAFAIEGTQVVTSYRLERGAATDAGQGSGERLVVEMLSFPSTVPITPAHDDVPPVTLYEPKTVQRAELRRTGGG